jgi:enoyl-CoA hydratase/carnithine racemase
MFSAGLDVPELLQLDQSAMSEFWDGFQGLLKTVACMPVPTVAAITGHSPAGGAVVSLFCDYRVMSDGPFKIGLNETQVGLMLPSFIHQALVRLVGAHTAERLVVSGAMMAPQAAVDKGLVDEVAADPGQTVSSAIEWCQRHLALPRTAMLTNRASMRASLVECFDVDSAEQNRKFLKVWFSEETRATLTALVASLKAK